MARHNRRHQGNDGNDPINPKEVKEWIRSLTWDDLLRAFEVYEEDAEFLMEMINLQVPPPTPIHPRAIVHPVASLKRPLSDGKYETDYERTRRERILKPRLLKWLAVSDVSSNRNPYKDINFYRNRKKTESKNKPTRLSLQYSVMARGFISRDGNRYAIPPTYEQQEADENFLNRVCLCSAMKIEAGTGAGLYLRIANTDPGNGRGLVVGTAKDSNSYSNLMNMLRITSRGNFLSQAQHAEKSLPTWFQPTERWFPLSMYFVARFEMSLVQSYHRRIEEKLNPNYGWLNASSHDFLQRVQSTVACPGPQFVSSFLAQVMKEALHRDSSSLTYIRDCLLRMLLLESCRSRASFDSYLPLIGTSVGSSSSAMVNLIWICPFYEVGSGAEQLRCLCREMLQHSLARQMQQELLLQEEEEVLGATSNNSEKGQEQYNKIINKRLQSKKKSKPRGRKNKQKQRETARGQQSTAFLQNCAVSSQQTLCRWVEEKDESKSSDEETQVTRHAKAHDFLIPENAEVSNRMRNRNIVLVLGLLDEIVQDVFGLVGLSSASSTEDLDDWEDGTKRKTGGSTTSSNKYIAYTRANDEVKSSDRKLASDYGQSGDNIVKEKQGDSQVQIQPPTKTSQVQESPASSEQSMDPNATWNCGHDMPNDLDLHDIEQLNAAAVPEFNFSRTSAGTTQGVFDIFASPYGNLSGGFFLRPESIDFAWDTHDFAFDQWSITGNLHAREQSIMEDLFLSQERREQEVASSTIASIASSGTEDNVTSNGGDDSYIIGNDDLNSEEPQFPDVVMDNAQQDLGVSANNLPGYSTEISERGEGVMALHFSLLASSELKAEASKIPADFDAIAEEQVKKLPASAVDDGKSAVDVRETIEPKVEQTIPANSCHSCHSPSPQALNTSPPTSSPILVSLGDLQQRKPKSPVNIQTIPASDVRSFSSVPGAASTAGAMASTPRVHPVPKPKMVSSLSRENLKSPASTDERSHRKPSLGLDLGELGESFRTLKHQRNTSFVKHPRQKSRDDTDIRNRGSTRRRPDALETYRAVASRSLAKSRDDHDVIRFLKATPASQRTVAYRAMAVNELGGPSSPPLDAVSAQSEIGNDDFAQHWHDNRSSHVGEEADNNTTTRDGSTTITSALSQRDTDENLREERDTYRDLCLTLGAEVAKLRNMLASQNQNFIMAPPQAFDFSSIPQHQVHHLQPLNGSSKYFDHPASLSNLVSSTARSKPLAAMSDAGYRGEYESMASMASEDDFVGGVGKISLPQRQTSSAATAASDGSVEHSAQQRQLDFTVGIPLNSQGNTSAMPLSGLQSRLSVDIVHFVDVISSQLRKQESKRAKSVERMTRLVTALWPRAQVKLYGSHVTGLCLPTSDVDFIICLPAVQKDTPAVAPGVLEGRNAINESSQKVLARKLKNESWIDPRSMKLIERTVVPVIKVATKDTKAKTLRLDITFDSPSHHGLEAVELVNRLLEEYPLIRPLVLVLKKFLLDRGLHTGYTGGLSSYCLFLMTARYLQEQVTSWTDCGALLMGFLDFYGNHFDPRTTGISVRLCQYFARPNYATARTPPHPQMMWNSARPSTYKPVAGFRERGGNVRRNSFSDKGNVDGLRGATTGAATVYSTGNPNTGPMLSSTEGGLGMRDPSVPMIPNCEVPDHGMPYTFDPLFVEDPLAVGNNVGRNTFRIFQVLRAFSDAHRALVASVEWDMQTSGVEDEAEYSLLKCLLQSEDVVFDL